MSESINPPYQTDPFTDPEKSDIRRFCGYGFVGLSNVFSNYRFFSPDNNLEYRMLNCTDSECVLARSYIATCNALEQALFQIGSGDTDTLTASAAASYIHNKNEIWDRSALLDMTRRKLCGLFRMPPGPDLDSADGVSCYN